MNDTDLLRAGLVLVYNDPSVEERALFKDTAMGTYHGSHDDYHGRAGLIGDCNCWDCARIALDDPLSPERRLVLVVPNPYIPDEVQLLLHARGSSFTTTTTTRKD